MKNPGTFLGGAMLLLLSISTPGQITSVLHDGTTGIDELAMMDDSLWIVSIIRESPAWNAGLREDDVILEINGTKVPGKEDRLYNILDLSNDRAGTNVRLKVREAEGDSVRTVTLIRDPNLSIWVFLDFDYLVDSTGQWTINDILSDSIQGLFSDPLSKKILIRTVDEGSRAEETGVRAGDRIVSLKRELDNFIELTPAHSLEWLTNDTILVLERDSALVTLPANPSEGYVLKGVTSQFTHDTRQHCMWLKFVVRSRLTEDRDYFFRVMSMADTVFLYIKSSTGQYHERRTGYDLKRDEKDIVYKSWDAFKIRFNQTGEQEFYVRLTGEDEIAIPYPAVVSMDKITVYSSTERMAISLLGGMILLMALYYLVLFFTSREKNYLFYSLFVMGFGFYLLDNWGYLGELPRPWLYHLTVDYMELVFALPVILFSLFTISYLELRKTLPVWFRLFQVNIGIIILTSMILIAFWLFSDKYPDLVYYPYRISTYLISGILILTTTVLRLRKKYKPAWYFLAASLAMIVLIAFYQQTDMEFSSDTLYASNLGVVLKNAGLLIGAVVQFLIFSIGLGQKMRHMEIARKKAQQRIIEQLRENEKLKDKVNRELEQKVQERTREIMEQKEEIEAQRDEIQLQRDVVTAQKQEIMDSIGYAKRIQNAVLPHREYLDEVMPDYFVLFRPRDVVSGDFYWVREVKNYLVVVAADCTGHGVPGAFMSMLGVSLLNEIVGKSRFDSPGEILNRLRKKIKETLTQEGKAHEQKDGMDMALVILDKESMELQYAGAYNPLYIFRTKDGQQGTLQDHPVTMENDLFQLFELKADRQPISIHEIETDFSTRTVRLQKGDTLYAFSDGYVDQRGGPRQKKFLSKNFKRFLLEIQPLTMQEQEETVADTLDDWMREIEQVDDILVMGIRV